MMSERQQLNAELTAIAAHLSGHWQLDPKYADHVWCAVLRDDAGHGLHFNMTASQNRLSISGMWPVDQQNQQHIPSKCQHITVARNRPPEKIATEIKHRFLPWYLAAYAEAAQQSQEADASRRKRQKVAMELAALLDKPISHSQLQSEEPHIFTPNLTVDIHSEDAITIHLRYISVNAAKTALWAVMKAGGLTK